LAKIWDIVYHTCGKFSLYTHTIRLVS